MTMTDEMPPFQKQIAVQPTWDTSSVAFLVGTTARGHKDEYIDQAGRWVDNIKAGAGHDGVMVTRLGRAAAVAGDILRMSKDGFDEKIPKSIRDDHLGGLNGHSLVFVTHGVDRGETRADRGLLFARGSPEINLLQFHLDHMKLKEKMAKGKGTGFYKVVPIDTLDELEIAEEGLSDREREAATKRFRQSVRDLVKVVDAIRQSVFSRVILAACGGSEEHPRLSAFAQRLSVLAGVHVYFNNETITLDEPPEPRPTAVVGKLVKKKVVRVAKGYLYFASEDEYNEVELRSDDDSFLRGSQERIILTR
jgi:hypothetical protein